MSPTPIDLLAAAIFLTSLGYAAAKFLISLFRRP